MQCDGLISFALFASFQRKNWKAIRRRTEQKCLEGHCQFPFVLVISAALFLSSYQPQLSSTPLHNVSFCLIQSDFCLFVWFGHLQRRMSDHLEKCSLEGHCQFPFVLVISAALFLSSYQPQLSSTPLHNVRICQIHSDFMPNNAKKCYPIQKVERSNQNYPKVLVISAALFLSSTCHSSVQQQCTMYDFVKFCPTL